MELERTRGLLNNLLREKAELEKQMDNIFLQIETLEDYLYQLEIGDFVNAIKLTNELWDKYRLTVPVTEDILEADEAIKAEEL